MPNRPCLIGIARFPLMTGTIVPIESMPHMMQLLSYLSRSGAFTWGFSL